MLSVEEFRMLNNPKIDIDLKMELTDRADATDMYIIKMMQRFNEKIEFDKYYLSYSGGKDSHLLYWFIKEILQDNKIKIVGINTFMEHHEIRDRILKNSDVVLYPIMKPKEIKAKYGSPCFSKQQDEYIYRYQKGCRSNSLMQRVTGFAFTGTDGKEHKSSFRLNKKARELLLSGELHQISPKCCTFMKKKPAHNYEKETGRKPILGIRGSEGIMRKVQYQTCLQKKGTFTPIFDMSDEIENEIYRRYKIEIPDVYNYIQRTGCMGCPYGNYKGDTQKELSLINENQRRFVCDYFKESYKVLGINTKVQTTIFDFIGDKENE